MTANLSQRLAAETIGTAFLLLALVGAGLMASEALPGGNAVLTLAAVGLAGGAVLSLMITMLGPLSGGHFNPAVTIAFALRGEIAWDRAAAYIAAQVVGGVVGVALANVMFGHGLLEMSATSRMGGGLWIGEIIATFALVFTVLMTVAKAPGATPWAVGTVLAAGHFFTASGAFANPAVTIARLFTNSFTGIDAASVFPFVVAELVGAVVAVALAAFLLSGSASPAAAAVATPSARPKKKAAA